MCHNNRSLFRATLRHGDVSAVFFFKIDVLMQHRGVLPVSKCDISIVQGVDSWRIQIVRLLGRATITRHLDRHFIRCGVEWSGVEYGVGIRGKCRLGRAYYPGNQAFMAWCCVDPVMCS
jgi:hypothetical protein